MLVSLLFFLDMGSFNAILEIGEGRIKLKFGKFFFFFSFFGTLGDGLYRWKDELEAVADMRWVNGQERP